MEMNWQNALTALEERRKHIWKDMIHAEEEGMYVMKELRFSMDNLDNLIAMIRGGLS